MPESIFLSVLDRKTTRADFSKNEPTQMKLYLPAVSYLFLAFMQSLAYAQEPQSAPRANPILEERLRNAEVTTKRLGNGATITEVDFAGSLKPNFDLGCISMDDVASNFNPPALNNQRYRSQFCFQNKRKKRKGSAPTWFLSRSSNKNKYEADPFNHAVGLSACGSAVAPVRLWLIRWRPILRG